MVAYHCDQYGKTSIVICLALDKGISNWRYSSFLFIHIVCNLLEVDQLIFPKDGNYLAYFEY